MKSIAFLLRYWPYFGGGETVTRILAHEFLNRGYEVHILYWWNRYEDRLYEDEDVIKKYRIDVPGPIGDSMTSPDCYHNLFIKLRDYVLSNNIDVVINQWWPAQVFEQKLSVKIISCHHANLIRPDRTRNPLRRLFHILFSKRFNAKRMIYIDKLYGISDLLVFLAESYKKEYKRYSAVFDDNKDTEFVHNPSTYSESIDDDWLNKKKNEVLFVGRVYENHKNLTLLLEVWRELLNLGVTDWTLKIIGEGPDLPLAKKNSSRLNLSNIVFMGAKDPKQDYATASLFVMTSKFEGWPMTIVEAQHYGVVPIVTNTFSALDEMLCDDSGIVVNSLDPSVIAREIFRVIDDKKRRIVLAENAKNKAESYNVAKIVDKWEKIFEKL